MNYRKLTDHILQNGGCSYSTIYGEIDKGGYAVSLDGLGEMMRVNDFDANELRNFVTLNSIELAYSENFLGVWIEDDIVHLDVSTWVSSKQKAEPLARANNQKAYWDFTNKKAIYL